MELPKISFYLFFILVFSSCYYDNEEELYPNSNCVTEEMSYTNDILPVLETNCYGCHANIIKLGNVDLQGHEDLLEYVETGQLIGAISHDPDYSPMPKSGAMLDDCTIEKFIAWIEQGALNN